MTKRIRQCSTIFFLLAAVFMANPAHVKADDCQGWLYNCVWQLDGTSLEFDCHYNIDCNAVLDCLGLVCTGPGTDIHCVEGCSPTGGPCGYGTCEN